MGRDSQSLAPTANHEVVELGDVCATCCSAEKPTHYSVPHRGTRHKAVHIIAAAEKGDGTVNFQAERQEPSGSIWPFVLSGSSFTVRVQVKLGKRLSPSPRQSLGKCQIHLCGRQN